MPMLGFLFLYNVLILREFSVFFGKDNTVYIIVLYSHSNTKIFVCCSAVITLYLLELLR